MSDRPCPWCDGRIDDAAVHHLTPELADRDRSVYYCSRTRRHVVIRPRGSLGRGVIILRSRVRTGRDKIRRPT